jgi:Ca-activated chloride channel family protein
VKRVLRQLAPLLFTLAIAGPALWGAAWAVEAVFEVPLATGQFRFQRPWAGLLLPAALVVLGVRGWLRQARAPRLLVSRGLDLARLEPGWRTWLTGLPTGLRVVALGLLALGLMGPQSIHARDRTDVEGIDIVLTLDCSLSMQANDIQPNRFDATKVVVDDFIRRRANDRVGAVIFGREAYTLLPLTSDHEALRGMIDEMQLGMIEGRGTAIGNAVGVALNRLRKSDAKSKVVILLTDGDSNSGNVSPDQAAEFAKTMGVKVYTVLMGQAADAQVQQGVDFFGRPIFDRGSFPINPELLASMAQRTGGEAFRATDRQGLERSFHSILDRLERSVIEDTGRVYGELFPAFVAPALLLLLAELLVTTLVLRRFP